MHRVFAVAILALFVGAALPADLTIPASTEVVIDQAGVIDAPTRARIAALFIRLRTLTTAEVKVLTVTTTKGEDIVAFAQRHYDLWQLGQRQQDNGAIIVLAVNDHHVRVHTGYGLEPVLPDSWCGSLSRSTVASDFKAGRYAEGLEQMSRAVAAEVAAAAHVNLDTGPRFAPSQGSPGASPRSSILMFILIGVLVVVSIWRSRNRLDSSGWGGSYGGFGGSASGGGSFGGGYSGGGGFSGGGGRSGGGGGGASW